jgi:hypothetical protein
MALLRRDLLDLLQRDPFQSFCVKLVDGNHHNVFFPLTISLLRGRVFAASPDGEWALFSYDKIASIESLFLEGSPIE